jgi:hypothetical protein
MPNICMFCDKPVNSKEHVYPMWIHERKDFGPLNFTRADGVVTVIPDPKVTARCVCEKCNNGWMSTKLEVPNIPVIGSMLQDISMTLDRDQQKHLAEWCMKMAFINDWSRTDGRRKKFYTRDETLAFGKDLTIPEGTRIWIGHLTTSHLSRDGHDFELLRGQDGVVVGTSSVTTLAVGHLVAQIVTNHILPEFTHLNPGVDPKPGPWDTTLIQIWPIEKEWVSWPPKGHFMNGGGPEGVGHLFHRWRRGPKAKGQLV